MNSDDTHSIRDAAICAMTYEYLFRDFMAKLPTTGDSQVAIEIQQRVIIYRCEPASSII